MELFRNLGWSGILGPVVGSRTLRVLLVAVLIGAPVLLAASPVAAAGGLAIASDTTYTVEPQNNLVRVESVYTLTNVTAPKTSGYTTTSYYYDSFGTGIHGEASNIVVTSRDRELTTEIEEIQEGGYSYKGISIRFPSNLNYRQTRVLTVSYELRGTTNARRPICG